MTPAELAAIHAVSFTAPRPWSEAEFAALLKTDGVFLVTAEQAFALGRVVADEVELLTIATHPDHRRRGLASRCLAGFEDTARQRGAITAFLEVAADNGPAQAFYTASGWTGTGRRKGYYRAADGTRIDAQLMGKTLG